ncbi:MAG: hypothetical protein D6800_05225 [Candidatus Zixiibacteriota bacterium]|nr:MAG: hypothetical protein D6800_05225 [candidate division Zixibacteria bacterium]
MTQTEALRALESLLESFLERMIKLKENRLRVLSGINRLDDIARNIRDEADLTEEVGGWFAEHKDWVNESVLRPSDRNRISAILAGIRRELHLTEETPPAVAKIAAEIDRWQQQDGRRKVVLKRRPESSPDKTAPEAEPDTIKMFRNHLERLTALFADMSGGKAHLISVLNHALDAATLQQNKEALHLAALLIYYLRRNGYLVGPFVERLKEAEALQQKARTHLTEGSAPHV